MDKQTSKVKKQSGRDEKKHQSQKRSKKLDVAVLNQLKKSKLFASQGISHSHIDLLEQNIKFQDFKQVKLPFKQSSMKNRSSDYATQLQAINQQPKLINNINNLSFKIDNPGGVSEQAQIYHFNYEGMLHKYINWSSLTQK